MITVALNMIMMKGLTMHFLPNPPPSWSKFAQWFPFKNKDHDPAIVTRKNAPTSPT